MPTSPALLAVSALAAGALTLGALAPLVVAEPGTPRSTAHASRDASPATVQLPVDNTRVLQEFVAPSVRWGPGHRGVDLAAAVGAPVRAPADGVVVVAQRVVDRDVLTILHDDGLRSSLEPVQADLPVGAAVRAGQVVGHVATGGHCAGCVHWGVRDGERYVDPLALLHRDVVVRLLPSGRRHGRVSRARSPAATSAGAASRRCASGRSATR